MSCPHPGKILLQQYLQPQNISQNRLACTIRVAPRRINEIVHEKRAVTADTAVRLGIYFGVSASYWMQLQAAFEIDKVKQKVTIQLNSMPLTAKADKPPAGNNTEIHRPKLNTGIKKRIMR